MSTLPSPERLATLVSNVTSTMLGISFVPEQGAALGGLVWRTALLPIPGARPITVGLSSDRAGCLTLSGAMFSVAADQVDSSMINDALSELVNMTAGLVRTAMAMDQALGLPRIVEEDAHSPADSTAVVLRAKGLGLVLWISEKV